MWRLLRVRRDPVLRYCCSVAIYTEMHALTPLPPRKRCTTCLRVTPTHDLGSDPNFLESHLWRLCG
jgi:hypothetical protein